MTHTASSDDTAPTGPLADAARAVAARTGVSLALRAVEGEGRAADRAAGLDAASTALHRAGSSHPAVAGHPADGRPRWPADCTGSIAHAHRVAVAAVVAVASRPPGGSVAVGVDLEVAGALPAVDAVAVLDATEQALVAADPRPDEVATILWSAKEAAFKAWCEATDGALGPVDPVDIHVDLGDAVDGLRPVRVRASGRLAAPTAPVGPLSGWCARTGGYVLVVVSDDRDRAHGVDGIASAATTNPSAENAIT